MNKKEELKKNSLKKVKQSKEIVPNHGIQTKRDSQSTSRRQFTTVT